MATTPTSSFIVNQHTSQDGLIIAQVIFGSVAATGCLVIIGVLCNRERLRLVTDRLVLGIFMHSFVFSVINAIPFNLEGGMDSSNASYCWWRGWWFGSSYGVLLYIIFILVANLNSHYASSPLPYKYEIYGHVLSNLVFLISIFGFVGKCYHIYGDDLARGDDDGAQGNRIIHEIFFPEMRGWLGLTIAATLLWAWTFTLNKSLEKGWTKFQKSLEFLESEELKVEQYANLDGVYLTYGRTVRPLRYYPIVFLVFGIPSVVFFADSCYNEETCRHTIEFIWGFRAYALIGCFLTSHENRRAVRRLPADCCHHFAVPTTSRSVAEKLLQEGASDDSDQCMRNISTGSRLDEYDYNMFQDDNNLLRAYSFAAPREPLSDPAADTVSKHSSTEC